jgi:hypothetical protein
MVVEIPVGCSRPKPAIAAGKVEGDAQVRMLIVRQRKLRGIGNGVVDGAVGNAVQQCLGVGAGVFHPHQIRQRVARRPAGFWRANCPRQFPDRLPIWPATRPRGAATVDQMLADSLIRRGRIRCRPSVCEGTFKPGCRQMRLPGGQGIVDFGVAVRTAVILSFTPSSSAKRRAKSYSGPSAYRHRPR